MEVLRLFLYNQVSHVTGYPARSRDKSRDRHTVTVTRSLSHGHRHTITATRSQPLRPGHVTGHVPSHVMSYVPGYVPAPLTMGTHQEPLALRHSQRPLAFWHPRPLLPFSPRPLFSLWPTPFVNYDQWRPLSLGGPWPSPISDLRRLLAYKALLATVGYQGVVVIRNGRVIKPIVRGGGLGGISWWCGGMS